MSSYQSWSWPTSGLPGAPLIITVPYCSYAPLDRYLVPVIVTVPRTFYHGHAAYLYLDHSSPLGTLGFSLPDFELLLSAAMSQSHSVCFPCAPKRTKGHLQPRKFCFKVLREEIVTSSAWHLDTERWRVPQLLYQGKCGKKNLLWHFPTQAKLMKRLSMLLKRYR